MVNRILRAFLLALVAIVMAASPAAADCESSPPPNTPNEGSWGSVVESRPYPVFSEVPESVEDATGPNPFAADSPTTVYHEYGWGSWKVHNYDPPDQGIPGCSDNRTMSGVVNMLINGVFNAITLVGAAAVFLIRLAFSPTTLSVFDPIMRLFADGLGNRLFVPLFPIALALTGAYVMAKARHGDMKQAGKDGGAAVGIAVVALICVIYGLTIAPVADKAITGAVGAVGEAVVNPVDEEASQLPGGNYQGEPLTMPDAIAANLVEAVVFPTWCSAQLGPGSGDTATEYCDDLFVASTLSRTEAAAIVANPGLADEIYEAKDDQYQEVAQKIKDEDEKAFAYLSGEKVADRLAPALLGLTAITIATAMLAYSMGRVIYSLLVTRLAMGVFPLIAIAAQLPPYRWLAARAGDVLVAALFNALLFGSIALVWIAAGLGGLLSPESGVPLATALLLMLVGSYAVWKLGKRFSMTPEFMKLTREERKARREARQDRRAAREQAAAPGSTAPDLPGPSDDPPVMAPADITPPRRSLAVGAAKGGAQSGLTAAAVGVFTGGTASVGIVAAGAARGAYETHQQNKAAKDQHQSVQAARAAQQMPYYPASSTTRPASESKIARPLPEGNPSRSRPAALTPGKSNLPMEARSRAGRATSNPIEGAVIYHPESTSAQNNLPVPTKPTTARKTFEVTEIKPVTTGGSKP